jgi:hypothetical protein
MAAAVAEGYSLGRIRLCDTLERLYLWNMCGETLRHGILLVYGPLARFYITLLSFSMLRSRDFEDGHVG